MRYGRILTAIIPILLLVSILPAIPSDTADADTASDGSTFFEDIEEPKPEESPEDVDPVEYVGDKVTSG